MPSSDITRCPGADSPLCATCWRKQMPQLEGVQCSSSQWVPNKKHRPWCSGYWKMEEPAC